MSFIGGLLFAIGTFIVGIICGLCICTNLFVNGFEANEEEMLEYIHQAINGDIK